MEEANAADVCGLDGPSETSGAPHYGRQLMEEGTSHTSKVCELGAWATFAAIIQRSSAGMGRAKDVGVPSTAVEDTCPATHIAGSCQGRSHKPCTVTADAPPPPQKKGGKPQFVFRTDC